MSDNIVDRTEYDTVINILQNINWQKFTNLCESVGTDFNSPQWRFMKAIILEKSLETYSDNKLKYVGEIERGCDFIIPSVNNVKIEMKYTNNVLYPPNKNILRPMCKNITLLNSRGTNTHINLPDNYADYLLIVEQYGAAIISKEKLKNYVVTQGDSLSACIPTNELIIVNNKTNFIPKKQNIDIKKTMMEAITVAINCITDTLDES